MSNQTATAEQDDHPHVTPVEGGRAWPVPVEVGMLRGASWATKPQRSFASTGVITADLLERTFV